MQFRIHDPVAHAGQSWCKVVYVEPHLVRIVNGAQVVREYFV